MASRRPALQVLIRLIKNCELVRFTKYTTIPYAALKVIYFSSDTHQSEAIAAILDRYGWIYFSILTSYDSYGEIFKLVNVSLFYSRPVVKSFLNNFLTFNKNFIGKVPLTIVLVTTSYAQYFKMNRNQWDAATTADSI